MSFETNTLVDGEWTTRTVDLNTILQYHDQQDKQASSDASQVEKAPTLGVLTQTVIRSPLIHWILPAKLRRLDLNDVAFIGADFVQIKELRGDGFLWDVVQREHLGARIRNARIIGSLEEYECELEVRANDYVVESEAAFVAASDHDEHPHSHGSQAAVLPPQWLLLQLETGDSIFLMLQESVSGGLKFVITTRHRVPKMMLSLQPGAHLSVDPSSRYMAVAGSEASFAIYELGSREHLKKQLARGLNLRHVIVDTFLPFNGVIHKMEFLYPADEDKDYVVLLVLIILKGRTRMIVYEWKTGDDIREIRPLSIRGFPLGPSHQLPLLLIPLRFKTTFVLVFEDEMILYKNILQHVPEPILFSNQTHPPTSLHHGSGAPLWTGWARPTNRTVIHKAHRDDIYIAREDGLLCFFEITKEMCLEGEMEVGSFEGRCGTSLACIDYRNYTNTTGDFLITGGDSCSGGAYFIGGRTTPKFTQSIQNWTPSQDFITVPTGRGQPAYSERHAETAPGGELVPSPDRLFACVGKGSKGALVEFHFGMEARIDLLVDCGQQVLQAWTLPAHVTSSDLVTGSLFLFSCVESSVVLSMSSDETSIEMIDGEAIKLDLDHRTIILHTSGEDIIQVTEQSVVFIRDSNRHIYEHQQLLLKQGETVWGSQIHDAVVYDSIILYTTFIEDAFYLQLLDLDIAIRQGWSQTSPSTEVSFTKTIGAFSSGVTGLAIYRTEVGLFAIIAEWRDSISTLNFLPVDGSGKRHTVDVSGLFASEVKPYAIVSIIVVPSSVDSSIALCGTRDGIILSIEFSHNEPSICHKQHYRIGATSVKLSKGRSPEHLLASCDLKAYDVAIGPHTHLGRLRINQIWLTDALKPGLSQPSIISLAGCSSRGEIGAENGLIFASNSQILVASLDVETKAIPRFLDIGGTPTRMLYCQDLDVIIVAASVEGKSTILFIDPGTGEDLSCPMDSQHGSQTDFVSGLGNTEERILQLLEWSYVKGTRTWNFIIVGTSRGRLLIISIQNHDAIGDEVKRSAGSSDNKTETASRRSKIAYYTRYRLGSRDPVYSVAGFADGLLWCAGERLFCDVLDLNQKSFNRVTTYELPSAAKALSVTDVTIYALTQQQSLEVFELIRGDDGTYDIIRKCGDQISRFPSHHIAINHLHDRPIHLISDKSRSIVGLWPTKDAVADTLECVFEGQLPSSILKFRTARCRQVWDPAWYAKARSSLPTPPNSMAVEDVLGLSIDGSLIRFTILDQSTWKYLRFLINICIRSPRVCEFWYRDDLMPTDVSSVPKSMMHVDGNILKRCLDERLLESLLLDGGDTAEADEMLLRFRSLLYTLHGGMIELNAPIEVYIEQAYADLELFLRPM